MTSPRTRLLASITTALGLVASGFDAHAAPQGDALWHGVTGAPSLALMAGALLAAFMVWWLGRSAPVGPFVWMAVGLLPLLPAITGFGAPVLFFSRYTVLLVFAILLGWTTRDLFSNLKRLQPFSAFLIAFVFFLAVGRFLPGPAGPQGDEPHYLLIAESLIRDGDVDLKNQFDERTFTKFTSGTLEPHTAPRSPKDRIYAIHTPGLAALIAPGYAAFGYAGARAMVSLALACVVGLLFFISRALLGVAAANFVFFTATFASPLPFYANSVFPDSVATLPVALTLACMMSMSPALIATASAAIAWLPWIHPRFLPLAAILALAIAVRGGFAIGRAAASFAPLVASVGLLMAHFQSLYGSSSLSAAYGPGFSSDVAIAHIPWGASALLLDRQFGLLLFSPLLLLGLGGAALLWTRDRRLGLLTIAVAGALLGVGGAFSMWWGGASAPARFLIGAVPVFLIWCGVTWHDSAEHRPYLGAGAGFGLGLVWLACLAPRALHNRSDGESGLLRLLSPVLDLDRFFPGFVRAEGWTWLALIWAGVVLFMILRPSLGRWTVLAPLAVAMLSATAPLLDPFASSLRVLEAWNDHRRIFGGRDTEGGFILDVPLGDLASDLTPGVRLYSPRFSLPAGAWTLRIVSRAEMSPDVSNVCRLSLVTDDESASPLASVVLQAGENIMGSDVSLALPERRVHLKGEGLQLRTRILKVTLVRGEH